MANKKYNLEELRGYRDEWPDIPEEAVPEEHRKKFALRKKAVDMYIDGATTKDIYSQTGVSHTHISELLQRTLTIQDNGSLYGYEGLIPNKKIQIDQGDPLGKFNRLLVQRPELKDFIAGNYYGDKNYTTEKNMNAKTLHGKFLKKCLELGVQEHEYPFNTANMGYVTLCRFLKKMDAENVNKAAKRQSKDDMQKLYSTGIGERITRNTIVPFNTVQVDGHIIDLLYNVEIVNIDGTIDKIPATRAWLFAVIDVSTRCILGYSLSQEFNYNQHDVLDAIKNAIVPHERLRYTIEGLTYPDNGGFPTLAFPELKYPMIDNIMLDNAKSHLAKHPVSKLTGKLQIALNFGSVATPETRGIVERFFGSLETRGFHKLPMTTGSSTKDLKRRDPEKALKKYDITYDEIHEIIEALISEYNNTPHSGINNLTPLESMRKKIYEAGMFPTLADKDLRKEVDQLDFMVDTRTVRGGKNGKRAYINYKGSEYRSNELSITNAYIGQQITIMINPRDISTVEAYAEDGHYIGTLKARGEFGQKSHSIKTRKLANKLARERGRAKLEFDTPIAAVENHLNKEGKTNRRKATKAEIIRREQGSKLSEDTQNVIDFEERKQEKKNPLEGVDTKNMSLEEVYNYLFVKET